MDKFYEKKYQDMETRLYRLYDGIEGVENSIEEVKNRLLNIQPVSYTHLDVYKRQDQIHSKILHPLQRI